MCHTDHSVSTNAHEDSTMKSSLGKIKNKFLIMSGKGGVGKTSVSVNLSAALAAKGFTVGLMDVDIHGPDIMRMLGLSGMLELNGEQKLIPMRYSENLKVVSIEALIPDKDKAIIWRGPKKHSLIRQFISEVEWGDLDFLIIDSPPGTGDEPLSVAQTISEAKAVIVTTPQEISLADVRKSINFCKTVRMEIFGLIENMSGFSCPHCGTTVNLFGFGGGEATAHQFGIEFLGRIPIDPRMVSCSDRGVSFQQQCADSPATKVFAEISEKMVQHSANLPVGARGNDRMKFAIPLANGKLTAHFGHCQEFAVIDVEHNQIVKQQRLVPPPHEPGVLPKWLGDMGTNVVIAGGMGQRAISLFNENGIKVIIGAPVDLPETLVMNYLNNTLVSGQNLCEGGDHHHECGGHGH